jgi:dihydroflavonol-4-reductase
MATRILVTGITGYLGQHVAAELLRQGYDVVGTVRNATKAQATTTALAAVAPTSGLTLVEADLLRDAGWDTAVAGCDGGIHLASPFVLAEPKNEQELIGPAVEGTRRVLAAAARAGVRRVVLTSSIVSMTAGAPSGRYGTDAWSDVTAPIGAYAKSKTLAERAAWEMVADGSMELVAINPGFIVGPSLGASDGTSVTLVRELTSGKMPAVPNIAMGMVDVRDVARLHVAALTADGAAGKRFIAASAEPIDMMHLATTLKAAGYKKVPTRRAPDFLIKAMALVDREARGMVSQLGVRVAYDNHETFDTLGWTPTPIEQTVVEMAASLQK